MNDQTRLTVAYHIALATLHTGESFPVRETDQVRSQREMIRSSLKHSCLFRDMSDGDLTELAGDLRQDIEGIYASPRFDHCRSEY